MPRASRVVVADVPLHITQRGVDRCPTFLSDEDFGFYLWAMQDASVEAECLVHAYALMTNHVHFLVTPRTVLGPSRLFRALGRRYVRYFNDRYRRTGTLWEGRFHSAVVTSTDYLLNCMRYIELNPVEAGLARDAGKYPWSSFRANALGATDPLVTPHRDYLASGVDAAERCAAYRAFFATPIDPTLLAAIRAAPRARPALRPTLQTSLYQELVEAMRETMPTTHRLWLGPTRLTPPETPVF